MKIAVATFVQLEERKEAKNWNHVHLLARTCTSNENNFCDIVAALEQQV